MEMKPFGWVFVPRPEKTTIEVDQRPIVLCEDCKQWDKDGSYMGRGWCGWNMKSTGPWFFCADGEKEEEDDNKKICATCKWRSDDFTSVCVNGESDHVTDFVSADDWCEEWEGNDERRKP